MAVFGDGHTFAFSNPIVIIAHGGWEVCDAAHSGFVMKKVRRQVADVGAPVAVSPLGIFAWYLPVLLGAMVRRRETGVKGPALSHRTRKGQGTLGSKVAEERLGQPPAYRSPLRLRRDQELAKNSER